MVAAPLRALMAMVLVLLALMGSGCSRGRPAPGPTAPAPIAAVAPSGRLQEVAPPPLVAQLAERLEERNPQLRILAPTDGALLPAGPWSLQLQLSDWPLSDGGGLGPGPHLVVQIDGQTVQRLTQADDLRDLHLPELAPGSHRITVFAARPWGESVKAPGASQQIRVHRVAANPGQIPAPGSAQLVLASPEGLAEAEPVLIDWLLLDAPLQNLREGDGRWRLRITVNGDSFLVDRHAPLWLRGFRSGSNALQMELLDGRGEPLNGPFNSLVREVRIQPGPVPGWLRSSLTPLELDLLSGLEPEDAVAAEWGPQGSIAPIAPASPTDPGGAAEPGPGPTPGAPSAAPAASQAAAGLVEAGPQPDAGAGPRPTAMEAPEPPAFSPEAEPTPAPAPVQAPAVPAAPPDTAASSPPAPAVETAPDREPLRDHQPEPVPVETPLPEPEAAQEPPAAAAPSTTAPRPTPEAMAGNDERIAPTTSLGGSARELVNPDGSLAQPRRSGPLARLRETLQR